MNEGKVKQCAFALAKLLDEDRIPYAIAGALALGAHGYERMTLDVDVLLTADGLARFKALHLGRGYLETFPGSKGLRDTQHGVPIDVLLAGGYPGDGLPKAVQFPDPSAPDAVDEGARFRVLRLEKLVELKLASGISAPHRLRDLADVLEVVRAAKLPREFAAGLDASVRDKFDELWLAAQSTD